MYIFTFGRHSTDPFVPCVFNRENMADDLAGLAREPYAALCTGWSVGGARFEVPLSLPRTQDGLSWNLIWKPAEAYAS